MWTNPLKQHHTQLQDHESHSALLLDQGNNFMQSLCPGQQSSSETLPEEPDGQAEILLSWEQHMVHEKLWIYTHF